MQMSKKAKGLHRSLFGRFRQFMEYKAEKFEKRLVIADKYYPSTQRCSACGHIKTGDEKITLSGNMKYGTKHHEYHCYECGYKADRDEKRRLKLISINIKKKLEVGSTSEDRNPLDALRGCLCRYLLKQITGMQLSTNVRRTHE